MRRKVIAGNWKMNKTMKECETFFDSSNSVNFCEVVKNTNHEVILCVPFIDLLSIPRMDKIKIGAQNMHYAKNGAYTGEISPEMLSSIGVEYVIIGHSERRKYFNETNETVNLKIKAALENEIKPIVCVGESLEQREQRIYNEVIVNQITKAFEGISDITNVLIAYEPIWAIGTGKTATPDDANDAIKIIRAEIANLYSWDVANEVIILYGGSVNSCNAKSLFEMSDIDGGLVGGASLDPLEFLKLINYDK